MDGLLTLLGMEGHKQEALKRSTMHLAQTPVLSEEQHVNVGTIKMGQTGLWVRYSFARHCRSGQVLTRLSKVELQSRKPPRESTKSSPTGCNSCQQVGPYIWVRANDLDATYDTFIIHGTRRRSFGQESRAL